MTECTLVKALSEDDPACRSQRWAYIGGLVGLVLATVCCGTACFCLLYRRMSAAFVESQAPGKGKEDMEEFDGGDGPPNVVFPEEEWDPEPPNETDAYPSVLYVSSPKNQTSCAGEYELVPHERPNGQPLWSKRGADRWLYSGTDGRWYIGGTRSRERNFACASGFIYCNRLHRSAPPDEMTAGWEWSQGKCWSKDPSIVIAATDIIVTAKAAKAAAPARTDVSSYSSEAVMPLAVLKDAARLWPQHGSLSQQGLPDSPKDFPGDGPGMYVITHDHTAVTPEVQLSQPTAFLEFGSYINVLEVERCTEQQRIRARIEKPDGWISLENLEDGYRWAQRHCASDVSTTGSARSLQPGSSEASTDPDSGSFTLPERFLPHVASPPSSTMGHSLGLSERAVDPPEARPLPPQDPPPSLFVSSPNGQRSCAGVYEFVPDERPNGQNLWKQRGMNHWLYCGKNGRWSIAGTDVREENFVRSAGFISQTAICRDQQPEEYTAPWQRWDGESFVVDNDISVSAVYPSSSWRGGRTPSSPSSAGSLSPKAKGSNTTASSTSSTGSAEVALECIQAVTIDVNCMSRLQRSLSKSVTETIPWRIGPRHQPEFFLGLSPQAWQQHCFFELSWKPSGLYLTRPSSDVVLLLDGETVQRPWSLLLHGAQIGLCRSGRPEPLLTLQVQLEGPLPEPTPGNAGLPHKAADDKPCVMDLRGRGLSAQGKSVVQASREETLRIIV